MLCTTYRPPNSCNIYWELLQESVAIAKSGTIPYIVITGDLNADPETLAGQKLHQFLEANHLVAHVREPTRVTEMNSAILDQFISNIPCFIKKVVVESPVSTNDHCTIGLKLLFRTKKKSAYSRLIWDFKNTNWDSFRAALQEANLDSYLNSDNVDTCCEQLTNAILQVAKDIIPNKTVVIRPDDKPWFTENLRRLRRVKERNHSKAKKCNTPQNWELYRTSRNTYINELNSAKDEFEKTKYVTLAEEGQRNSKKWWHILKAVLGQTNDASFPPLHIDGEIVTEDKDKAAAFNKFFSSAAQLEDSHAVIEDYLQGTEATLDYITVTEQDVFDQLSSLDINKAYGPDGLSPRLFKEGRDLIAPVLCKLFNLSLNNGVVPKIWKRANVLPIFKKGEKERLNNYRPVSLLNCGAKVFEKVVFKYVFNHFKDNFLISTHQSGFLPGRSTITQLTELYHAFCKAVSEGKEIRVVFLDISKAFDRVWHSGLLHKLEKFGIKGKLLSWFTNYLKDRYQRVVINGQSSDWAKLKAGVPQGAVLGPLLFLVFINDIVYVIRHCKIRLFADNTCLFIEVQSNLY